MPRKKKEKESDVTHNEPRIAPEKKKKEKEESFDDLQKSPEKEESIEVFEVEKDGKDKIIETKSTEILNEIPNETQVKSENRMMIKIFLALGILIASFFGVWFFMNSFNDFEYKGINFETVKEIAPYRTSIPVLYQGVETDYNFYLRNDPRELENIDFYGNLNIKPFMVLNATNSLNCGGDGIIAIANLANLYKVLGTQVIKDQNATCDQNGTYMFLNIAAGNESKIEKYGPSCYQLNVANCEILKVTEKFMVESLARIEEIT
ncbi:hypothetical protein HYT25_03575 [Candidatus Pacearchaeota archaeon]|nr:hypothetical protein [Candidatus Pacearchaeota archaeon]